MFFYEVLVGAPGYAFTLDRCLLRAKGNLVRMKVMEPKLVKQRFFDQLMSEDERLISDTLRPRAESRWQVAVNKYCSAIYTIPCYIRYIVGSVHFPHPTSKCLYNLPH